MASTKTRQRKLERDRYERKLVRQAQHQRRRRRGWSGVGALLSVAVLGVGTAWLLGAFEKPPPEPEALPLCTWQEPAEASSERVDVGLPDPNPPVEGAATATLELDAGEAGAGPVEFAVDVAEHPCAAASLAHLASAGFYDDTSCHELTADGAVRCGDPGGTGAGGPAYLFYDLNLPIADDPIPPEPAPTPTPDAGEPTPEAGEPTPDPADQDAGGESEPVYPAGTVVLADVTGAHGSQFMIFFEDFAPEQAIWPILGTVTSGLDLVEAIGAAGVAGDEAPGPPAEEVRIVSLTVAGPEADADEAAQ